MKEILILIKIDINSLELFHLKDKEIQLNNIIQRFKI